MQGLLSMRPVNMICHCRVQSKGSRSRSVIFWQTILSTLAVLSVSITLAEDFKTIHGKEYKDATIIRVEGDGIMLRTKTGISKIYFTELPRNVQERFHYGQATPTAAQREPIKEDKEDERRQSDKGRKVVVVGQGALILKLIAGTVILVGVLIAFIRRRY
jgi:hypothetical protein